MFERAMAFVERWEGGWSDDPRDPGGLTKWGVTLRALAAAALDVTGDGRVDRRDLAAMTRAEARAFYRAAYWNACRCGDMPPAVALLVFDSAVNQGPRRAARIVQAAAGVAADGIVGPVTLAAIEREARLRPDSFLRDVAARRALHYSGLPHIVRFGLGWFRRLFAAHLEAARLPNIRDGYAAPRADS
ncbi:glycoside hydrolase family 108 protein [Oceanicella actignis]|uniref:Predicted Peptidoglycan domain-containing protein n=1 Tax=Oceanicella actignis TaxID=1189325 RepID=A0A1M7U1M7_9RHOB|nr:glycosyl hydrolase 108 family protein [Oceanicella actignis]SES77279.1 Predicted Peptidoglycan domain-containing protein [Oceanicella actignis]SHN76813.1 Predicted Peptidoglycan domain-containing protein [Oceanicella actignis]